VNAAGLLQDLESRGIRVEASGSNLVVDGPAEALSDEILDQLKELKAELLRHLISCRNSEPWDASDWQTYFDERAGICEHDGTLSQTDAERLAFDDVVTHWLCLHPAKASDPRQGCVHCGQREQPGDVLLPVLALGGHTWVHDECWAPWHLQRRREAADALNNLGLVGLPSPSPTGRTETGDVA
jgi:hypothetical protein